MQELKLEQGSMEWHNARHGKVTGTSLADACGSPTKQKGLLYKLVSQRMTEPEIEELTAPAVLHGIEMEPIALEYASNALGLKFETTGMLISSEIPNFGFSPDAVVREGDKVVGGIEIKCPMSKTHIQYCLETGVPEKYDHQTIAPFIVSEDIKWWYFMSFDDRNYNRPAYFYLIERENVIDKIEKYKLKLKQFLKKVEDAHASLAF